MGNLVAIAVGIVAFAVVFAAGSPIGAALFGLLMYGMAYGAFAWKPGKPETDRIESSERDQITPEQIGKALGASLFAGHNPTEIAARERSIVHAAGVPLHRYVLERFVLNACAAAFAIESSIPPGYRNRVFAGLEMSIEELAAPFPELRDCRKAFQEKLSIYRQAAEVDGSSGPEEEVVSVSRISGAFADVLASQASPTDASQSMCHVLAMTVADAHWTGRVQGSRIFLQQAEGLLRSNV